MKPGYTIRCYLLSILQLGLFYCAEAQYSDYFKNIGTNDGLSYGAVSTIAQDTLGFIWIGTKNGLNRYDGRSFEVYHNRNSQLLGNGISKIFFDSHQRMWVGTYNGLYRYEPLRERFQLITYQNSAVRSAVIQINDILMDVEGMLWLAAEDGLYRVENDTIIDVTLDGLLDTSIKAVAYQPDSHTLYLGTKDQGVWSYTLDEEALVPLGTEEDRTLNVRTMAVLEDQLVIGTWRRGLYMTDQNEQLQKVILDSYDISKAIINSLDKTGDQLWVGLSDGLLKLSYPSFSVDNYYQPSDQPYSLSGPGVSCAFADRDGNMWFGSPEDGLGILTPQNSEIGPYFTTPGQDPLTSQIELKSGKPLLAATANIVRSLLADYDNVLALDELYVVLGSYRNGLAIINRDNGEVRRYSTNDPGSTISHDHIRDALIADSVIYLATWGGGLNVYHIQNRQFDHYRHTSEDPRSLTDDDVIAIVQQNDSILWLATYGGGLNRFNTLTAEFTSFLSVPFDANTISSNDVIDLFLDSRGYLWVGHWGHGVDRVSVSDFMVERFSQVYGIPNSIITAIEEDKAGNILFSSKSGIAKYDMSRDIVLAYPSAFGASTGSFEIGHSASDNNGNIYFSGEFGYVKINDAAKAKNGLRDFDVLITAVSILGEVLTPESDLLDKPLIYYQADDVLQLAYYHNAISFDLSIPVYPTRDIYYEVKLDGLDENWRPLGRLPVATFTSLNPGGYKLQVRAHFGNFEDYYYSDVLAINVRGPWWTSIWAFILYSMLFVVLLYLFFNYSTRWARVQSKLKTERLLRRKEHELAELKQRFFTNLSHEVRTPITLIINSLDQLTQKSMLTKEEQASFFSIRKNANRLTQLAGEMLDLRRIDEGKKDLNFTKNDFLSFVREIYLSFQDTADRKNQSLELVTQLEGLDLYFDRIQMEKVIYNLISNALKFTGDHGKVVIDITANDQFLYLNVTDNGRGISAEDQQMIFKPFVQGGGGQATKGFGLGLSILKDIVERHAGEVLLESEVGIGSTFMIKLPLGSSHLPADQINAESEDLIINDVSENSAVDDLLEGANLDNRTLLVVEDNEELRHYLVSMFTNYFRVLEAADGKQGLVITYEKLPDLVISDIMMPEMDGIQLTKSLKGDRRTSHIPIVLLTARSSLIYKYEGYETGADDYITKPFNKTLLISRVKNLLQSREILAKKVQTDLITEPKRLPINSKDQEFLKELIDLIDTNLIEDKLNASFIVEALSMSHSVVYKKVKALTGLSLIEFIRDYRLKKAAELISELGYSISEATYSVGFSDTKYFSKMFKKKFGVNPSKYRKTS